MKINRLFSIAAAALMMVACSSEDTALKNTPAAGPQMQFTATIAAPGSGATTRTEYTEVTTGEAAGTISVAWKVGDEIALIHNGVKDVATVKTVNADGSATINGYVTGATNEADVQLYYPAALVKSVTNDGNPVFDNDLWGKISTQDGTLKYIQDNLDFRSAKGQLSVNETSATLKEAATMNSMHAIWKLSLQDDAETPAALLAKKVSVQLTADVPILRASTAELTTPISSFYLAMEPFTDAPITIEATVGDDTYKYEKKSVSIASGKYYQSTVTMEKKVASTPLDNTTTAWTAGTFAVPAGGLTYSDAITVSGDVTLTLTDGETLTLNKGISLASGATLTIQGNGTMNVNGTNESTASTVAGSGTIILTSGTLTATGGNGGGYRDREGLESSKQAGGVAINGAVTVSGGTLTATGGAGGSIGRSNYDVTAGAGGAAISGSVTLVSGTLTATGGNGGNAGDRSSGNAGAGGAAIGGNLTVNGGTMTTTNGSNGSQSVTTVVVVGAGGKAVAGTVTDNR